jgi:branched-chain amino acid transport system permease protein
VVGVAALLALLLAVPFFASSTFLHLGVLILFYAYLGQAWNLLGGYAGQFSFGHAAFFGLGAYASSLLYLRLGVSPWLGLVAGSGVAAAFGLACGHLGFRYNLRGPYFALVMLAFAEMLRVIAENWAAVGGAQGLLLPLRGDSLLDLQFTSRAPFFYLLAALTGALTGLTWAIQRRRLGYALRAIRDNEEAAESLGVDTYRAKMTVMAVSAGATAVGGSLYAQYLLHMDPEIGFGAAMSIEILLRPIIGGAGTVLGPLLGSLLLTPLSEGAKAVFRGHSGLHLMAYGALLVAVILFLPEGAMGLIGRVRARLSAWAQPRQQGGAGAGGGASGTPEAREDGSHA